MAVWQASIRLSDCLADFYGGIQLYDTLYGKGAFMRYKENRGAQGDRRQRRTLITQFLSEGMVQAVISLGLALALTELMLPLFNEAMGTKYH